VCCGTEREVTVTCPLDCEYLREAREHEKPSGLDSESVPHRDVKVTERFLEENSNLFTRVAEELVEGAFETRGVSDFDVRDALEALIRTLRTLQSGVYYESRPENSLANSLFTRVLRAVEDFRAEEQKKGLPSTRDSDVLGVLVFLQRIELDRNNGRPRGRSFIHQLHRFYRDAITAPGAAESPLILP
jgi:hypothetical protein